MGVNARSTTWPLNVCPSWANGVVVNETAERERAILSRHLDLSGKKKHRKSPTYYCGVTFRHCNRVSHFDWK